MSDSVQPHRRLPTRLPHPWDSPGKNTGVGCHFLLQRMQVKRATLEASKCVEDATMGNTMVGRRQQLAFLEEKYLAKETSQQTIKNKIK